MSNRFTQLTRWAKDPRKLLLVALGLFVAVAVLVAVPVISSSKPAFFAQYHSLTKSSDNLESSSHEGIACNKCHTDKRGAVFYKVAVAADFYTNIAAKKKAARFVKFDKPTSEACLSCHENAWSDDSKRTSRIPHPAHLRVASETRECVKCHKWTAHEETYMKKHKEMPFSGVCVAYGCHVGVKQSEECYTCHHVLEETAVKWTAEHPKIAQAVGSNACMESCHEADQCRLCHTTGQRPKFTGLATETGLKAIEAKHVKSDWTKVHGAEALKDQSKCMKCHVSDGECRDCHTRKRPSSHGSTASWIGQHNKVAKDERRCLTCHKKPWCEDCHDQFKEMR